MGGLSWWHWIIIAGAFVLLFGAKKLPEAARGVGASLRILKSEVSVLSDEYNDTGGGTHRSSDAAAKSAPVSGTPSGVRPVIAEPQMSGDVVPDEAQASVPAGV